MFGWFWQFFGIFWKKWNRLDEELKCKIIELIIKFFEEFIRDFYNDWKRKEKEKKV